MAKSILENDRCAWAGEKGYATRLCRMEPVVASAKNDILIGWPEEDPPLKSHITALSMPLLAEPTAELTAAETGPREEPSSSVLGGWMEEGGSPRETKRAKVAAGEGGGGGGGGGQGGAAGGLEGGLGLEVKSALAKDFTTEEVNTVHSELVAFRDGSETKRDFPPGQGNRHRKLIHAVAHGMGFRHWTLGGKKSSQRYAVVEKAPPGAGDAPR